MSFKSTLRSGRPLPYRRSITILLAVAGLFSLSFIGLSDSPVVVRVRAVTQIARADQPDAEALKRSVLQEKLNILTATWGKKLGNSGIYVEHLGNGLTSTHQADTVFRSASLYKPFVAYETLRLADGGRLSLKDRAPGTKRTLEECIKLAISVSDNPCGQALQKVTRATRTKLTSLEADGYLNTDLRGEYPKTSARDVGRFFLNLHHQRILSSRSHSLMNNALVDQHVNDRLPALLPSTIEVAHKTGDLGGVIHDGGIVHAASGSYVVVVMTDNSNLRTPQDKYRQMAEFSRALYDLFENAVY